MPGPRPLSGEWMEVQFIRYTHRRTWRNMQAQAGYPPEKRKSIMARVKTEKQARQDYQEFRRQIIDLFDDLETPALYARDQLFIITQSYMAEHKLDAIPAVARISAILKENRRALHSKLYSAEEHQHVWIKRTVDGFTCISCPALGTWDGDDSHSMEVVVK